MKRLFLDANVLFTAAHNPDGKAYLIISLGIKGAWEVYTSGFAVEEARRNLAVKYPSSQKIFNEFISAMTVVPESPDELYPTGLNEKDRPIFHAAHACGASHLITGDLVHFGSYMNAQTSGKESYEDTYGIIVQTPSMFLSSL